jgi:glycosyltransferase involved in cell wall biosynthesis
MSKTRARIAVISMGVKLGREDKGYTRFLTIAEQLCDAGFEVALITTSFQHWEKAQRDITDAAYRAYPFEVVFIPEPGYAKNIDPARVYSHSQAAKNLKSHLSGGPAFDLVYCEVPPNDVARAAGEYAAKMGIPFIIDVNDLWPEAMRMVFDVPLLSSLLFMGLKRDSERVYAAASAVVGTSDEYAQRPFRGRDDDSRERLTVYVGASRQAFDEGAKAHAQAVNKPPGAFWISYAGTLGASYDISTMIKAAAGLDDAQGLKPEVLIIGDGPDRDRLESLAASLKAPVRFLGHRPYPEMAAWLRASDVLVNSLVRKAPQSIVNKIADYLFAGRPMVNTGSSSEFRNLVVTERIGLNVTAEDSELLRQAFNRLMGDGEARAQMGANARLLGERRFDRARSYADISSLVFRQLGL